MALGMVVMIFYKCFVRHGLFGVVLNCTLLLGAALTSSFASMDPPCLSYLSCVCMDVFYVKAEPCSVQCMNATFAAI